MTKPFEYRGDLAQTTLPEILFAIHRFQVAGVIEAEREGVTKRIVLKDGLVVHATSTDLDDSLGGHLRRKGVLLGAQIEDVMRARRTSERRLGELLVENGLMSPANVYAAIREHVEEIVWSLFYWQDGQVVFRIGEQKDIGASIRILLPLRQVILSGIKRVPDPKPLVARLGRRHTVFAPCYQYEDLIDSGLNAEDLALLQLVDGSRRLVEVCTQGPGTPGDNAKLIYAFHVLQLIQRVETEDHRLTDTGKIKIVLRADRS